MNILFSSLAKPVSSHRRRWFASKVKVIGQLKFGQLQDPNTNFELPTHYLKKFLEFSFLIGLNC